MADWQIGIGYLAGSLNGSLCGLLSGYLDGWLAIWLAGYLAGWLGGGCALAGWLFGGLLVSWLARALAIWLSGWLPIPRYLVGWLSGWLGGWLFGSLSIYLDWSIFAVFSPRTSKKNDRLGIYFVRNKFFRTRQGLCKTKFKKKKIGKFSRMYFSSCFLFLVMFLHCAFWGVRKNVIFSGRKNAEKMTFFRVRQYGAFWLQRSHCGDGYHFFPPIGLNLESAEISASKLANQFKTTNVKIHPAVPKMYTHLICFGQIRNGDATHDFRRNVQKKIFFRASEKMLLFRAMAPGWLSEKILVIWLAGYLAGWLAICLAGWLSSWLGWLPGWLFSYWLSGLNGSLSGLLSGYLDGWLAIWLAGYLVGWLGGGLRTGWLIVWWFAR